MAESLTRMPAATVEPSNEERRPVRRKAVSVVEIEGHFPICFVKGSPTCAICLSHIEATEPCRKTKCNHEFHADCIMQWWTKEKGKVLNCPTCREAQRVTVSKVRQINLEVRQKEQECRDTPDRHSSQPQQQRQQEQPQNPLARLLESVRAVLPKPVRASSSDSTASASSESTASSSSSQAAPQRSDAEAAERQGSEYSGI